MLPGITHLCPFDLLLYLSKRYIYVDNNSVYIKTIYREKKKERGEDKNWLYGGGGVAY